MTKFHTQFLGNRRVTMHGPMTRRAQRYKILLAVVCLVLVYVMNVKMVSPPLATSAAKLARPLIAVLDGLREGLPVEGVVPFGDAALPGGIVDTTAGAGEVQRLTHWASFYPVLLKGFAYGVYGNTGLGSQSGRRSALDNILTVKPAPVMIWTFWAMVSVCILLPSLVLAIPFHKLPTSALAGRRRFSFRRLVDDRAIGMTGLSLTGRSNGDALPSEVVENARISNAKLSCDVIGAAQRSFGQRCGVKPNDSVDVLSGQLALLHTLARRSRNTSCVNGPPNSGSAYAESRRDLCNGWKATITSRRSVQADDLPNIGRSKFTHSAPPVNGLYTIALNCQAEGGA